MNSVTDAPVSAGELPASSAVVVRFMNCDTALFSCPASGVAMKAWNNSGLAPPWVEAVLWLRPALVALTSPNPAKRPLGALADDAGDVPPGEPNSAATSDARRGNFMPWPLATRRVAVLPAVRR